MVNPFCGGSLANLARYTKQMPGPGVTVGTEFRIVVGGKDVRMRGATGKGVGGGGS